MDAQYSNEEEYTINLFSLEQNREGDIFFALWDGNIASYIPRIFYQDTNNSTDCRAISLLESPVPHTAFADYAASLYAMNTYRDQVAVSSVCDNINEERIPDPETGVYYCACKEGKECSEDTHLLELRIVLLVIFCVVSIVILIVITWKGGHAFYTLDKAEAVLEEEQRREYDTNV
jgi:hypothetical protein